MSLSERVAVVTGASSGIGAAVARDLSRAGVRVLVSARRADRLEELCRGLPDADFLEGDLGCDPQLPEMLMERALNRFGDCHIVVNNAGILEAGEIDKVDLDRISKMVRVNVEAAYRMAYVALRYFKRVNRGDLINTSSVLGTKTRSTAGAYAGTKYAIEALSEALRLELADTPIRVCCIEPGLVRTELHDHYPVHPAAGLGIKKPLRPEDVARCVRFVLEQPPDVLIPRLMVLPKWGAI